ncbi:transmembrane amino acid transporter protein-domain-containing protein [Geranomyces variabilis]|nr:transmembrane amino acid transporter protein-domain-containing protein [Geranomyces variabilis]KAJ3139197.1 hypothetical protein HDU90_000561 [Geranomyces variabilis]
MLASPAHSRRQSSAHSLGSRQSSEQDDLHSPDAAEFTFDDGKVESTAPTILSSSVSVTNTILGTQLLAIPYTFSKLGPGLGTVLLLFFALLTRSSLRLLVSAAQAVGYHDTRSARLTEQNTPSYATLSRAAFGKAYAAPIVDLIMAFATFGFAVAYLKEIAEGVPQILGELMAAEGDVTAPAWTSGRGLGLLVLLFLLIPLSFSRDVDDFRWFSGTAFCCAVYLAGVVVWCAASGDGLQQPAPTLPSTPGERPWFIITNKAIGVLPVFVFLFTCHQNMFSVYNELAAAESTFPGQEENVTKIHTIIDIAIVVCSIIYLAVGFAGYVSFGSEVHEMILNDYTPIAATTLARISFVLLSAFSYPIQLHPCRAALDSLFTHFERHTRGRAPSLAAYAALEPSRRLGGSSFALLAPTAASQSERRTRRWLTVGLLVATHACVLGVPEPLLSKLLVFLGATCGSAICYVLPGMIFRRIADSEGVFASPVKNGSKGITDVDFK